MLEVMQPEWEEKDMCMCVKTEQKCVPLGGVQRSVEDSLGRGTTHAKKTQRLETLHP